MERGFFWVAAAGERVATVEFSRVFLEAQLPWTAVGAE